MAFYNDSIDISATNAKEDPFAALRLSWSELIALEVAFRALSGGLKLHSRTTLCQSYFWSLAFFEIFWCDASFCLFLW